MDGADLARVLAAGAVAGQLGTAFLLSPESGANDTYKPRSPTRRSIAPTSPARSPVGGPAAW